MADVSERDVRARNHRRTLQINSAQQHISRGLDGHFDFLIVRFDHLRGECAFEPMIRLRGHVDLKGEKP